MSLACIQWALHTLQNLGYLVRNATPELILKTPWSCVYRFDTDQGRCYLKQVPAGLSLEPQVINLLRTTCGASVPLLIADNPQAHCFLMQDAGMPLRDKFVGNEFGRAQRPHQGENQDGFHKFFKLNGFDGNLFVTAIHDYIAVQRKSIPQLNNLINLGASDWRLSKIPECYSTLIQQEELLIADGLTEIELKQLSHTLPKLVLLCEQLSQYPIPETFSHNDFHDNNLLIDPKTKKITLVDLGEVAVTHPFFSLLNSLQHAKEKHALQEDVYQRLQQQALQPWLDYASQDQLLEVLSLIEQCWSIHRVLTVYRLLTSIEAAGARQLLGQGRFAKMLRIWLAQSPL